MHGWASPVPAEGGLCVKLGFCEKMASDGVVWAWRRRSGDDGEPVAANLQLPTPIFSCIVPACPRLLPIASLAVVRCAADRARRGPSARPGCIEAV
jgi:hypothetical protein